MDGILNINKATGMTSHDVVAIIRKLLKQKRVGHTGTLDPTASGVLPICVAQATRVAEYLSESGKAYQAEIVLGIVTDSYDSAGAITHAASVPFFTHAYLNETVQHFLGTQLQIPPRYSAIKLGGQPAYKRMRAGEEITMEPRPIVIYRCEIIDWQSPCLTLALECSKGTYIRSLAHDLGERLGCGAHLATLVRTRSGPFTLSESITLEQLAEAVHTEKVTTYLHPMDVALQQYPALYLDTITAEQVLHGNPFRNDQAESISLARVYDNDGHFLAIAKWDEQVGLWQPKKVLVDAKD